MVNTSFQVGGAVVLAITTAVFGNASAEVGDPAAFVGDAHRAVGVIALLALSGLVVALSGLVAWRRLPAAALGRATA